MRLRTGPAVVAVIRDHNPDQVIWLNKAGFCGNYGMQYLHKEYGTRNASFNLVFVHVGCNGLFNFLSCFGKHSP